VITNPNAPNVQTGIRNTRGGAFERRMTRQLRRHPPADRRRLLRLFDIQAHRSARQTRPHDGTHRTVTGLLRATRKNCLPTDGVTGPPVHRTARTTCSAVAGENSRGMSRNLVVTNCRSRSCAQSDLSAWLRPHPADRGRTNVKLDCYVDHRAIRRECHRALPDAGGTRVRTSVNVA